MRWQADQLLLHLHTRLWMQHVVCDPPDMGRRKGRRRYACTSIIQDGEHSNHLNISLLGLLQGICTPDTSGKEPDALLSTLAC
jgi:hypothetical protein